MSSSRDCLSLFNKASLKSNKCDSIQRKMGKYFWQTAEGSLIPVTNITDTKMKEFRKLEKQYDACLDELDAEYKKYSSCKYGKK